MQFILVKLTDGSSVVGEFQQRQAMRRFAANVMSGQKAFPVWRTVSNAHPHSGEPVLMRTREFVNGNLILSMVEVEPVSVGTDGEVNMDPQNFQPVAAIQRKGSLGSWVAPAEATPEGAVAGASYPVHRDDSDARRYVILLAGNEDREEVRHYLDAERAGLRDEWDDDHDEDDADIDYGDDGDDDY